MSALVGQWIQGGKSKYTGKTKAGSTCALWSFAAAFSIVFSALQRCTVGISALQPLMLPSHRLSCHEPGTREWRRDNLESLQGRLGDCDGTSSGVTYGLMGLSLSDSGLCPRRYVLSRFASSSDSARGVS